jgi:hypothetical protein
MPFNRDIRTCWLNVEFNEAFIYECLSDIDDMNDDQTKIKIYVHNEHFTKYVVELEDSFTLALDMNRVINFDDWFLDNYNNVYAYNTLDYELEE